MLGKANEIKTVHIFDRLGNQDTQTNNWLSAHPDAEILSMQFTSHYCHSDEATICSVFIIYKECGSQPSEFIDKEKLLTDIKANQAAKAWDIQQWIEDGEFDVRGGATP